MDGRDVLRRTAQRFLARAPGGQWVWRLWTRIRPERTSLGAAALEMEGGAVVQVCRQFRVGCLVVRSVTDYADGQALASYDQFFKTASENAATVVTRIIRGLK